MLREKKNNKNTYWDKCLHNLHEQFQKNLGYEYSERRRIRRNEDLPSKNLNGFKESVKTLDFMVVRN